jgi:hypothetical protein
MDRIAIAFCSGSPLRHRDALESPLAPRVDDAPLTAGAIQRRMV